MSSILQIKYSKKQLRYSLIFGILWIVIFVAYLIFRSESYFGYGYLTIGIVFIGIYVYKKTFHYATINNGVLTKHNFTPKRIQLDQIIDVHYFAGKYTFKTEKSEISINTMEIDEKSIEDLKKIIHQINISKS